MAKAAFNKKSAPFTSTFDLKLRAKLLKCYIQSTALYSAETWTIFNLYFFTVHVNDIHI